MDDGTRWDARHRETPDPVPRSPDGLVGLEDVLPDGGRALDAACGLGASTLWAARRGFTVDALDASPLAVARLASRAGALGLAGAVRARVADLTGGLPADLTGPYDLIVCQRFRDRALHRSLPALLAPRGVLVLTVLAEVGASTPSRFAAAAGELSRLARSSGCEVLRDVEGDGEATVALRRPAPGPSSRRGVPREHGAHRRRARGEST